ncbi:MAG: membrane protein insertase YidC [Stellaceae bacterium]
MEQRNLLIAIVISVVILIGFQFVYERFAPPPAPTHHPTTSAPAAPPPSAAAPRVPSTATAPAKPETRAAALASEPQIAIGTPRLHGSIDLQGARFDNLTLADYHVSVSPKSPEVVLLRPSGTKNTYFARFGWAAGGSGVKVPGPDTVWQAATQEPLTPTHPVVLTWDNAAGLRFTKTISVDRNYMFTIRDSVRNTGKTPVTLTPYGLISRSGKLAGSSTWYVHVGLAGYLAGHVFGTSGWFSDPDSYAKLLPGEPRNYTSTGGWLGFTDKYWLTSLIPPQHEKIEARFAHNKAGSTSRYEARFEGPAVTLAPAATTASSTRFFAGAKELNLLRAYTAAGIPKFDLAIDFGKFYFLTEPIFLTLQLFKHAIGNFGVAILLFTFMVKLMFFPLANKSYKAMSRMRLLQPEVQKLRERFPDDKARQQQEMMALYKRVGANPLSGCLPIVIQLPVFYALYKVLYVTLEMRHAPFFGWIHDLSAPDPTSFVNLFGLLPFAPPHFLMIGAWPIIMGVTMFLQQKLNPQPVDPMQARMFLILPVVFTWMLAAFPVGLVIYWAWNNLLSVAQQWAIYRSSA